jgi:hypothetical protein
MSLSWSRIILRPPAGRTRPEPARPIGSDRVEGRMGNAFVVCSIFVGLGALIALLRPRGQP